MDSQATEVPSNTLGIFVKEENGSITEEFRSLSTGSSGVALKPFECEQCGKKFARSDTLRKHMTFIHMNFTSSTLLTNRTRNHSDVRPYKCRDCGSSFKKKGHLQIHRRIHSVEKPFKCEECGLCYASTSNLATHKRFHIWTKPFKATEGPSNTLGIFINEESGSITEEFSSLPAGSSSGEVLKLFECEECGKEFTRSDTPENHVRIHSGENPYKCGECEQGSLYRSDSSEEHGTHSGDKPHKCEECGEAFMWYVNLSRHILKTHACECRDCGMIFTSRSLLTNHMKVHSDERPYKCDECGASFKMNCHLQMHRRIHSIEKPFKCEKCGLCYASNNNLALHERFHASTKPFKGET